MTNGMHYNMKAESTSIYIKQYYFHRTSVVSLYVSNTPCPKKCHYFMTITLAFLGRFLSFFSPMETGMNTP